MTEQNSTHNDDTQHDDEAGVIAFSTEGLTDAENGSVAALIYATKIVEHVTKKFRDQLDEAALPFVPGDIVLQYLALIQEAYMRKAAKLCGEEIPDGHNVGLLSANPIKRTNNTEGGDK